MNKYSPVSEQTQPEVSTQAHIQTAEPYREISHLHWWSSPTQYLKKFATIRDTHHSIALGAALGIFIGLTPTVGIQMLLVVLLGLICRPFFRFNQLAGLIAVYVSNPLTTIPLYWVMFRLGAVFTGAQGANEQFQRVVEMWKSHGWRSLLSMTEEVVPAMMLGSLLIAIPCGLLTYPLMRWFLSTWKNHQSGHHPKSHKHNSADTNSVLQFEPGEETTQLAAYETQPLPRFSNKDVKLVSATAK